MVKHEVSFPSGVEAFRLDALLWRLPAPMLPAVRPILAAYKRAKVPVWNPARTLELADRRALFTRLTAKDIFALPYRDALPGSPIDAGSLAMPALGGETLGGGEGVRVPAEIREPWIQQPLETKQVRVLVVDGFSVRGELLTSGGALPFKVGRGQEEIALAAARACGTVLAAVDIAQSGAVAAVHVVPDIPAAIVDETAYWLARKLNALKTKPQGSP